MKTSPSQLSTRYLPFLVVAAVMCLLVVLTPSRGPDAGLAAGGGDFSGDGDFSGADGSNSDDGDLSSGGDGTEPGGIDGSATGEPGTGGGGFGGGGGGADVAVGASGDVGGGADGGGGGGGAQQAGGGDRSSCEGDLQKSGPYAVGVTCRPNTDTNPGATMNGVTPTEVRYVWFNPPSNAVVDGILAGVGYARETPKFCDAMIAFEKSAQKYFELSGRKLVAMDGPGNNAGSSGCDGRYKFWQSTCPSGAPDPACARAEAKTIAQQLKPAFVLNPRGSAVLHEELARFGVFDIGYGGSRQRFQQFAPYLWGTGFGSERLFGLHSEYYCKRLVGEPPRHAGDSVKALNQERQVGLIYPDNGDGSLQPAVDLWLKTVRGCGDGDAKVYSYQSDVTRAQQQSTNIVAQLRSDGVTTVGFCCDPVSMVFFLQAMNQSGYEPEQLIMPASSIASDVVGQLATQLGFGNQWRHAFGISNYPVNQPDADAEYRKAYADGGGPGGAPGAGAIETESWGVFKLMMQMIHQAGPAITPRSVFDGMQALPPVAPSKRTTGEDFGPPDPFTPARDVAEIWWNPNLRSYFNDTAGAHCYVSGGARYDLGKVPSGRPAPLFGSNADCVRLEEYE